LLTGWTVRLARADDAAAIASVYNQGIEDRVATFETEPRLPEAIAPRLALARYPAVVVEAGTGLGAFAWAGEYRPRTAYAEVAEFSVYVAREVRGQGVGRLALAALIREAEARGLTKLVSRIFPENVASRRLCASLGFREVGVYQRHGRLDGRWMDCVIVERLLGDAARD
jgi:L-amino acid N-acyltransferase YncA